MSAHRVARLDEIPEVEGADGARWRPLRHHFGISSFGVNAWFGEAEGDPVIDEHDELEGGAAGHEELYLVVRGRAEFTIDGEAVDAREGTLIFIGDPTARRAATAKQPDTVVLAVGAQPGSFDVSPWEARRVGD